MRACASVFSWIGGIVTMALEILWIAPLCQYDPLFLVLLCICILWDLFVLFWRQISVATGKKVAAGVFTLIFVSLVGGILTLCIPEDQLRR